MTAARIVLLLNALAWVGFGVWLMLDPMGLAGVGLVADSPLGRIEVRGFYGGLELGIGAFLLWCAAAPGRYSAGLLMAGLTVGAIAAGRLVGIALEGGSTTSLMWGFVAIETTACVVSLVARRGVPETPGG